MGIRFLRRIELKPKRKARRKLFYLAKEDFPPMKGAVVERGFSFASRHIEGSMQFYKVKNVTFGSNDAVTIAVERVG